MADPAPYRYGETVVAWIGEWNMAVLATFQSLGTRRGQVVVQPLHTKRPQAVPGDQVYRADALTAEWLRLRAQMPQDWDRIRQLGEQVAARQPRQQWFPMDAR